MLQKLAIIGEIGFSKVLDKGALFLFELEMVPCIKKNVFPTVEWKNFKGLHSALTSTPSNTVGMNWDTDCEPGLITEHQWPTSQMLLGGNTCKCGKPYHKQHISAFNFGMTCSTIAHCFRVQLPTYLWLSIVAAFKVLQYKSSFTKVPTFSLYNPL